MDERVIPDFRERYPTRVLRAVDGLPPNRLVLDVLHSDRVPLDHLAADVNAPVGTVPIVADFADVICCSRQAIPIDPRVEDFVDRTADLNTFLQTNNTACTSTSKYLGQQHHGRANPSTYSDSSPKASVA